jgi:hypothetical protein
MMKVIHKVAAVIVVGTVILHRMKKDKRAAKKAIVNQVKVNQKRKK